MDISITNVYLDQGAGERGAAAGPVALHDAGIVAALTSHGHRVVSQHEILQDEIASVGSDPRVRFLDAVASVCGRLADTVELTLRSGRFPLIIGGDHSQSIGSIGGLVRHFRRAGKELGVLWVDAHADMNTPETTPSGNVHGMPLAVLLGHGRDEFIRIGGCAPALDVRHVVLFGVRDMDPGEEELVKTSGVRVFTMSEIRARGVDICLAEALDLLDRASAGVHLSFDIDVLDPCLAPGVTTPVPHGLGRDEAFAICKVLAQTGRLTSVELTELNPERDASNRTIELAVGLIESALFVRPQVRPHLHSKESTRRRALATKRRASIVAGSLYREMVAQGFAPGEMINVASDLLDELILHIKDSDSANSLVQPIHAAAGSTGEAA